MRRIVRLAPLLALALTLTAGGCRQATTRDGKAPTADGKGRRGAEVELPDPLPLPAEPKAASWIAAPAAAVALIQPYSPEPLDLAVAIEQALAALTEPELAAAIAGAVDLGAPFANVILDDGQEVIRLSLRGEQRDQLGARMAKLDRVGEFGAVRLPPRPSADGQPARTDGREWLAWIDDADPAQAGGSTLVIANSLPGVVTGRALAAAYGQQPVFFTADPSQLLAQLPDGVEVPAIPLSRVTGRGDLTALTIEAQTLADQDPFTDAPIAAGTLGGLLDHANIAAGASTRYADYQEVVRDVIVEVNATVAELPFLIRSVGEGLAAKLNTALRTWDGRLLVALGPQNHVRLAYGAADVEKSRVAAIRLLQAIVDNVALARNFSNQVPKISLRRKVATAQGVDIEQFVVHDASAMGAELRPLLDKEGRLNLAMAWSKRAGGGLVVVGPNAADELARWLDAAADAADGDATAKQLIAASFAAEPEQLRALLSAGPSVQPAQILGLAGAGPRWQVSIEPREAGKYVIHVRAPG